MHPRKKILDPTGGCTENEATNKDENLKKKKILDVAFGLSWIFIVRSLDFDPAYCSLHSRFRPNSYKSSTSLNNKASMLPGNRGP